MNRLNAFLLLACAAGAVGAEDWRMTDASTLTFNARQQRAEFTGRFEEFSTDIRFDPDAPGDGRIAATIVLESVDTDYADRDRYLRDTEWFNIAEWPRATWKTDDIVARDGGFVGRGTLTLRGVSRPVDLRFDFERDGDEARLRGTAEILRLDFGIGTGDWADTKWVGNEVEVQVDLHLRAATE